MGDELRRLGVPADLLPLDFLFAGHPRRSPFTFRRTWTGTRPSAVCRWPRPSHSPMPTPQSWTAWTTPSPHEAKTLVDMMRVEHDERQRALRSGPTMDTLFFSIQG
ncbi:hypothetical protein [Streptomyces smyrnaeus]